MIKKKHPVRTLRGSDKNWAKFVKNKPRGITWDSYIEMINRIFDNQLSNEEQMAELEKMANGGDPLAAEILKNKNKNL